MDALSRLARLPQAERAKFLSALTDDEVESLLHDWSQVGRPDQQPPPGDWLTWLLLAGRGYGKTRTGAEWIRQRVMEGFRRIALVGPTAADVRKVMVEGESGLLSVCWSGDVDNHNQPTGIPSYNPSLRTVTWPNGAQAFLYSAEEPNRLRGPQHDTAWADEVAAWEKPEGTWDMLMFGLRLGRNPQVVATTTPRPIPIVRNLLNDPQTYPTHGSTYDNRANLAPKFFESIVKKYEGTRLGRQELRAEILEDVEGALWTRANIEKNRIIRAQVPELRRIVIGIDPSGASDADAKAITTTHNEIGIVAAGVGTDGRGYILHDHSMIGGPLQWAATAVALYRKTDFGPGDRIIAEINYGGAMVESTIRAVDARVPVTTVTASRGKVQRAEPVAALSEKNQIKFVGAFPKLEDELCFFTPLGYVGGSSPNRADAMIWAITELMLGESTYNILGLI